MQNKLFRKKKSLLDFGPQLENTKLQAKIDKY